MLRRQVKTPRTDRDSYPASLGPCPDTPNCVSSQAEGTSRWVAPFPCVGACTEMLSKLRVILASSPGAAVVVSTDSYLRVEFTSAVFRFKDELELLADPNEGVIQVRSASRVGHFDWGANRRRVEYLRKRLARVLE